MKKSVLFRHIRKDMNLSFIKLLYCNRKGLIALLSCKGIISFNQLTGTLCRSHYYGITALDNLLAFGRV